MHSQSKTLVSRFHPIAGKRETKGNETGNGLETKRRFLCRCGNEHETSIGNEAAIFRAVRFHRDHAEATQL